FKPTNRKAPLYDAMQMGVDALKRIREARFHGYAASAELLPGEQPEPVDPFAYQD
ncbi:unnamed protein product, partial [marine sediment metagenome]